MDGIVGRSIAIFHSRLTFYDFMANFVLRLILCVKVNTVCKGLFCVVVNYFVLRSILCAKVNLGLWLILCAKVNFVC